MFKLDEIDYEMIGHVLNEEQLTESGTGRLYVDSSNIKSIWFEDTTSMGIGVLSIEFVSGAVYEYYRFPSVLFDRFLVAPSYGKFMWRHIRGKYPYQRIK